MKKSARILGVITLFLLVVCLFCTGISAKADIKDINNDGKIDEKDFAYYYGMNLDEFLKETASFQNDFLGKEENIDGFIQGLSAGKNEEKFLEVWTGKKENKEPMLGDKPKNKIWQYFSSHEQSNEYLKKIADKFIKQIHGSKPGVEVSEVILKNPEKLIWQGNKIGILNDKGDLKLWIDFEKIPYWMRKINFDGEKFNCLFDTGYTKKNIVFTGGTIGELGELIGPNGKRIGAHMNEDLQSIKYDNAKKQFVVKYNLMGQEKTLTIGESDLPPEIRQKIIGALNDQGVMGDKLREILGELDGLGVDFRKSDEGGVPAQNMLNVLYGENKGQSETIEISYNDKNELNIKVKQGGTLVTTDAKGVVERVYEQWASQPGDEEGVFLFKSNGEIEAAQNGVINVMGFGKTYVSRAELIGVNIARNSIVDAIARGDKKAVLEAVFEKGSGLVDELGLSLNKRELREAGFDAQGTNLPKVQAQLLGILKEELENPDLAIEYKVQIQDAIQKITDNLGEFGSNLIDYSLIRDRDIGSLSADEKRVLDSTKSLIKKGFEDSMIELLSDPEKLLELSKYTQDGKFYGDKEAANEFLRNFLKKRADVVISTLGTEEAVNQLNTLLNNPKVVDIIGKPEGIPSSKEEILKKAYSAIDGIDFQALVENSIKSRNSGNSGSSAWAGNIESSITDILKKQGVSDSDAKKMSSAFASLVSQAEKKVESESNNFYQRLKEDFSSQRKYKNSIYIDTYLNKVSVNSDKVVIFDAVSPLNEFRATSTRKEGDHEESVIQLWSAGNKVAVFDGAETRVDRIVNQEGYVSINRIVNTQNGNVLKLDGNSYGYNLYDPTQLVTKSNSLLTIGWRRAHPILQTIVEGPLEGDIASNPDSSVTMIVGSDSPTRLTRFGFRIMKKRMGGFPISELGGPAKAGISQAIEQLKEWAGGEDSLNEGFNKGNKFLSDIQSTGAQVPQIITDGYYLTSHLDELNKLADFISTSPKLQLQDRIVFTGTYIEMGGRRIEMSPEIHRMILRAVAANPVNKHWSLRQGISIGKKGGPSEEDLF